MRESPAHDVVVGSYPSASVEDVDHAIETARTAFDEGPWPRESGAVRARLLRRVAELIDENSERLAFVEAVVRVHGGPDRREHAIQAADSILLYADQQISFYMAKPLPIGRGSAGAIPRKITV